MAALAVDAVFRRLGRDILRDWRAKGGSDGDLPRIAAARLRYAQPWRASGWLDIVAWAQTARRLPVQARIDQDFGQPPLTLFHDPRLRVDILFWHTGSTGIHTHQFGGAFAVLHGSSVHCRYRFEPRRALAPGLGLGSLELLEAEHLTRGAVREISRGNRLIHSLFHLDTPSATIVVRTPDSPQRGREMEFHPPDLAEESANADAASIKRRQLLALLLKTGSPSYERIADMSIGRGLRDAYGVLRQARVRQNDLRAFKRLLRVARRRHGRDVDLLLPAIEEERRRAAIILRRKTVADPDLRFFLAALMNLPDLASVRTVIRARHPDEDETELISRWSRTLTAIGVRDAGLFRPLFR